MFSISIRFIMVMGLWLLVLGFPFMGQTADNFSFLGVPAAFEGGGRAVRSSPAALRDCGASAAIPHATPPPPDSTQEELFCMPETLPLLWVADCDTITDYNQRKQCSQRALVQIIFDEIRKANVYPAGEHSQFVEGICIVQTLITQEGEMRDIKIVKPIGCSLDKTALDIAYYLQQNYRWLPAQHCCGQGAIACRINIPIRFRAY